MANIDIATTLNTPCPYCHAKIGEQCFRIDKGTGGKIHTWQWHSGRVILENISPKRKRISFLARRGEQPPKRGTFTIPMRKSMNELWVEIYDLIESKTDESKYINPIHKDNPYYRSGVNDGLRIALSKMDKPKIAYLSKIGKRKTSGIL